MKEKMILVSCSYLMVWTLDSKACVIIYQKLKDNTLIFDPGLYQLLFLGINDSYGQHFLNWSSVEQERCN